MLIVCGGCFPLLGFLFTGPVLAFPGVTAFYVAFAPSTLLNRILLAAAMLVGSLTAGVVGYNLTGYLAVDDGNINFTIYTIYLTIAVGAVVLSVVLGLFLWVFRHYFGWRIVDTHAQTSEARQFTLWHLLAAITFMAIALAATRGLIVSLNQHESILVALFALALWGVAAIFMQFNGIWAILGVRNWRLALLLSCFGPLVFMAALNGMLVFAGWPLGWRLQFIPAWVVGGFAFTTYAPCFILRMQDYRLIVGGGE